MTSSDQIQQLSQQTSALGNHKCDEPNITAWAIHAAHFKDGKLQSSLSQGFTSLEQDGTAIDQNTRFGVGSLTKMFTSAGLLKLWDDELTYLKTSKLSADQTTTSSIDNFPKINFPLGIDTPLSHFMERLKNKFPESTYLSQIEEVEHYSKVTLRDLLNHTHGLGARDEEQIAKFQLQNPNHEFSCSQLVEFSKYNPNDKFGEFNYGNLGCELSGMIIELITDKPYRQAMKDLVFDQVQATNTYLKSIEINDPYAVRGYCYITPCTLDGELFMGGEMNFNTSGNSLASGGLVTNPADADKFISKFLNKDLSESLFNNQEVIESLYRDQHLDGKHHLCGVYKYPDGTFGHNGHSGSGESSLRYNPATSETFFYSATGETLTYAVAYEILDLQRKKDGVDNEISSQETIAKREELIKSGYDFLKIKKMHDAGIGFENIAKTISENLEQRSAKSSSFVERFASHRNSADKQR